MRSPRAAQSALAAVTAASLAVLAAACSGQAAGLVGTIAEGTSAGAPTTPDRPADYTAYLANHTDHVVVLKSAQLLPLKGFRSPRLVHEAVETGRTVASSDRDWPPTGPRLSLTDFAGYRVQPGREVRILYSVMAHRLGEYADAGIKVTALVNGGWATVDVISFAGTCIVRAIGRNCPGTFYQRVHDAPVP